MPTTYLSRADLIADARKTGKLIYSPYQDLCFTPDELELANAKGRYCWGPGSFDLCSPTDRLQYLDKAIDDQIRQRNELAKRVGLELRKMPPPHLIVYAQRDLLHDNRNFTTSPNTWNDGYIDGINDVFFRLGQLVGTDACPDPTDPDRGKFDVNLLCTGLAAALGLSQEAWAAAQTVFGYGERTPLVPDSTRPDNANSWSSRNA